jgi:hypothetical protein
LRDYKTAVRLADQILDACGIAGGALGAAFGAEIIREYFLRSARGGQARQALLTEGDERLPDRQPLS